MKRNILKILSLLVCVIFTACSEEPNASVQMNSEASDFVMKSASAWEGVIAVENNGEIEMVVDENLLRADLEKTLYDQGIQTSLRTLVIDERAALNDPSDSAFVLIGSDNDGISIGVFMEKSYSEPHNSFVFTVDRSLDFIRTTCKGCAQGCNLQYLTIDGKKIPICNENGCYYNCEKIQTSK